jgi:hypothetical protein
VSTSQSSCGTVVDMVVVAVVIVVVAFAFLLENFVVVDAVSKACMFQVILFDTVSWCK